MLLNHDWPGNVRELENCLERATIMSETGLIDRDVVLFHASERPQTGFSAPVAVNKPAIATDV